MTGLHSVIGILAALRHLDETGEGQHVETNLLSTAMSSLVNQTSAYVAGDVVPQRMGNAHLSLFPYEPLATGDGDLIVVAGNDGQYRSLMDVLGAPELADDDRFATRRARNDNREELRPSCSSCCRRSRPRNGSTTSPRRHPVRPHQRRPGRRRARRAARARARRRDRRHPDGPQPRRLLQDPARYDLRTARAGCRRRPTSAAGSAWTPPDGDLGARPTSRRTA